METITSTVEALPLALLCFGLVALPLFGFPVSPLWIAVGLQAGVWWGSLLSGVTLILNQTVGYWLARKWLRNPITKWLNRWRNVSLVIPEKDQTMWILLLRVTPGVPLFVQNYALGLAQVRFSRYISISVPVQLSYAIGFVMLGNAFKDSNVWKGMLALSSLATISLVVVLIRRRLLERIEPHSKL